MDTPAENIITEAGSSDGCESPSISSASHGHKGISAQLSGHEFIHVAPHPGLAGFDGAHERMFRVVEMLRRVSVLR